MRIKNNSECCHEFFYVSDYDTVNQDYMFGTQCSFGKNYSDDKNTLLNFYSYYTKVAMLYKSDKTNETYLLIHWGSMTATTGKHLSYLRSSNPYYITISVPFIYGEHTTSLRSIKNQLIKHIQAFYNDKECLYKSDNRNFYNEVKTAFNEIDMYIGLDDDDFQYLDLINEIDDFINNDDFIQKKKAAAAKKAAETKAKNKAKKEKIEQFRKDLEAKYTYYDLIKNTFYYKNFDYDLQQIIKNEVLPVHYSYVWFNDDDLTVSTSRHIRVNRAEVETMLKLWKHNKLKMGMTLDRYTVLEVKENYIKIGCHTIPIENIQALYEHMTDKKHISNVA